MKTMSSIQSVLLILISLFSITSFSQEKAKNDLENALDTNEMMLQGYENAITKYISDKSIENLVNGILAKNSNSKVSAYLNTTKHNIQTSSKVLQLIQSEYKALLTNQKLIYSQMLENSSEFDRDNITNRVKKFVQEREKFSKSLLKVQKDLPISSGHPVSENHALGITTAIVIGAGSAVFFLAALVFLSGIFTIIGLAILSMLNVATATVMLALKSILVGTLVIGGIVGGYSEHLNQQQEPITKEILEMKTELDMNIKFLRTFDKEVLSKTQLP